MEAIYALVVEDEPMIRFTLCEFLNDAGFETFEAGHAQEGISMLETHPEITVVFTDIQMPGDMDGLGLAHFVRDRYPPTAIVISSGNVRPAAHELPKSTYFIAKPYSNDVLAPVFSKVRDDIALAGPLTKVQTGGTKHLAPVRRLSRAS